MNSIYADLVTAVHERGYEKRRAYGPIRRLTLDQFSRVLEEIGMAAWHGDGRTTTIREIEEHCKTSGLASMLEDFQEGAKAGVTRLLAAFSSVSTVSGSVATLRLFLHTKALVSILPLAA